MHHGPDGSTVHAHSGVTVGTASSPATSLPADDGVDVTLIRWMLSLSPRERLRVLQGNVQSILKLRHARSRT